MNLCFRSWMSSRDIALGTPYSPAVSVFELLSGTELGAIGSDVIVFGHCLPGWFSWTNTGISPLGPLADLAYWRNRSICSTLPAIDFSSTMFLGPSK
jgi:hypothetical protein